MNNYSAKPFLAKQATIIDLLTTIIVGNNNMDVSGCNIGKTAKRRMNKIHAERIREIQKGDMLPSTTTLGTKGSIEFYDVFFTGRKLQHVHDSLKFCLTDYLAVPEFINRKGQLVKQPRKSMWFGPCPYEYSQYTLPNFRFRDFLVLDNIRQDMEVVFQCPLNSCLVNVYRDGNDGVAWHSDNEVIFGSCPTIVSVSLGASRVFELCQSKVSHRERYAQHSFQLGNGSVLAMVGDVQDYWVHRIPIQPSVREERWNLTFRNVVG